MLSILKQKNTLEFTRKTKEAPVLIIHIDNASIGAALVVPQKESVPKIVFTVREIMPIKETFDANALSQAVDETLARVLTKVSEETFLKPSEAYVGFSLPWHTSRLQTAVFAQAEPFRVSQALLDEITNKNIEHIYRTEDNLLLNKHDEHVERIEKKILSLRLDGQYATDAIGQWARKVELSFFTSFVEQEFCARIDQSLKEVFPITHIEHHSFLLGFFITMREAWERDDDFLLVHASGEITHIGVVKEGDLQETLSFPCGKNTFIRSIASLRKALFSESAARIEMYLSGLTSDKEAHAIEKSLREVREEWKRHYKESIQTLRDTEGLPARIALVASEPYENFFSTLIDEVSKEEGGKSSFYVVPVNAELLSSFVEYEKMIQRDPALTMGSIYAHKLFLLGK